MENSLFAIRVIGASYSGLWLVAEAGEYFIVDDITKTRLFSTFEAAADYAKKLNRQCPTKYIERFEAVRFLIAPCYDKINPTLYQNMISIGQKHGIYICQWQGVCELVALLQQKIDELGNSNDLNFLL